MKVHNNEKLTKDEDDEKGHNISQNTLIHKVLVK